MIHSQPNSLNQNIEGLFFNGCAYRIENGRVIISINEIQSQRDFDNTSGTLSVELWALRQPNQGGTFDGVALAGTQIGQLSGQHFLANCEYDLLLQQPPVGTWNLSLMLREWTDAGFVTRDFVNFDLPYVVSWVPSVVQGNSDNVINVTFAETDAQKEIQDSSEAAKDVQVKEKTLAQPEAKTEKQIEPEKKVELEKVEPEKAAKPATKETVAKVTEAKETVLNETVEKPAVTATVAKVPEAPKAKAKTSEGVSVNDASVDEIAALNGVSKKLAVKIVESRPFETVDQLLKVRGMGEKLLKRIRKDITL